MTIKFIVDKLKIKDREELQKIIKDIKTKPYKPDYPKESKILKKFILAILKTYETGERSITKVPSHVSFKLPTPSPIDFNLNKTLKTPSKIEFNTAPEKLEL